MSTSRIDELRQKFDENPRRYFAPLANEYRKAGDFTTAIALCREHLPKQPGHMSGHIVYGQALFEAGTFEESRQVFEAALALDPENVIALRHLGEIARANGDALLARRWYERMLDADPRNDEIAQQLATLFTPAAPIAAVPEYAPSARPTPAAAFDLAAFMPVATPDASSRNVDEHAEERIDLSDLHHDDDNAVEVQQHEDVAQAHDEEAAESIAHADVSFSDEATADTASDEDMRRWSIDSIAPRTISKEAQAIDDAFADAADSASYDDFDVVTGDQSAHDANEETHAEPIDIGNALAAFGAHDPVHEIDPEVGGAPTAPADVEAPPSLSSHDYSAEFEEGLIAPEWPDTSDLVSRVEHPPRVASVTPGFSQVAAAAFGRETVDPEQQAEEEVEYGEREMAPADESEVVAASDTAPGVIVGDEEQAVEASDAESTVADSEPIGADATVEPTETQHDNDVALFGAEEQVEAVTVAEEEARAEPVAAAVAELETTQEVEAVAADDDTQEVAAIADADDTQEVEAIADQDLTQEMEVVAESDFADEFDTQETEAVASDPQHTDSLVEGAGVEAEQDDALNAADEAQIETIASAPAEVQEVARAIARDARASGEQEAIRIEMHEGTETEAPSHAPPHRSYAEAPESAAFVTETMAELLISQGFIERAANVYEELVRRRPYDPVLVARLGELRERLAETSVVEASSHATADQPVESNDASDDTSEASQPVEEDVMHASIPTPIIAPLAMSRDEPESPRVTARERFARIATRRVPRRTPPRAAVAIESPADGLAGLFGSADEQSSDEFAARAFADAFATTEEPPFRPSHGTPVFVTRTVTSPSSQAIERPSASTESASPARPNSGFSFDRFFPDPATVAPTPPASPVTGNRSQTPESTSQSPPVSDDLAEFAAWLKGLDKP